jgi:hypothetical protein
MNLDSRLAEAEAYINLVLAKIALVRTELENTAAQKRVDGALGILRPRKIACKSS